MADTTALKISCKICGITKNLKRCGICKHAYYCSRDHQIKDWKQHKRICESLKSVEHTDHGVTNTNGTVNGKYQNCNVNPDSGISAKGKVVNCPRNGNIDYLGEQISSTHNDKQTEYDDLIPFDERPFRGEDFISMHTNVTDSDIAKIAVSNLNEKGFCVIDGLFTKTQIKNALKDINKCSDDGKFNSGKVGGGKSSREHDKQEVVADIRKDKIMWLEGTEQDLQGITSIVSRMDSILWEFNNFLNKKYFINGRSKAMVACYPGNGSYYRRHVDNPHGDGRVVTCILYLNESWNVQEDGGLLRIFPAGSDNYVDIAPIANRLLFFWCDRRNPHEVHPAYKTRYAITVWYMDEEERKRANEECMVATVTGESVLKECQQKQNERDEVNQKMSDVASDAVASLSLDELQAISALISGQSNPEDILAGMGISPEIRTKLLKKLHALEIDT